MGEWIGTARMRYGHAFDSENLNEQSRQLYEDLKSSYERIARLERELSEQKENNDDEVRALTGHLMALEDALSSLETRIGPTIGMRTIFAREMLVKDEPEKAAALHVEEAVVACKPRRTLDKLTMSNEQGERFLPSVVEVKVGRTNNGGSVIDRGEREMLEGKSVWRREVSYDTVSAPIKEDAIFEVSVPLLFSGDRLVNEIVIHPFPNATVEVAEVMVETAGTWKVIPWEKPPQEPARAMGPIRLSFKETPVTAVRVRVVQEVRRDRGAKSSFVLGLEALEIKHTIHQNDEQYFLSKTSMSGAYGVSRIEPIFQHPVAERQYRTELYRERDGILLPIDPSTWHSMSEETLWVKVWLQQDASTGSSPILQAVRIHTTAG